jgi:hypothetical protein
LPLVFFLRFGSTSFIAVTHPSVRYWPIADTQVHEIKAVRAAAIDPKRTSAVLQRGLSAAEPIYSRQGIDHRYETELTLPAPKDGAGNAALHK